MKKTILFIAFLTLGFNAYSQKELVATYPLWPIYDVKTGYDEELNLVYNVKLVNKAKVAITQIFFLLEPTWMESDTQLGRALKAEKTIKLKQNVKVGSGGTVIHKLYPPNNQYAVSISVVRYSDGSIKQY